MKERKYPCWVLMNTEIQHVARVHGYHLSRTQEVVIAQRFKDALGWALDDWERHPR